MTLRKALGILSIVGAFSTLGWFLSLMIPIKIVLGMFALAIIITGLLVLGINLIIGDN